MQQLEVTAYFPALDSGATAFVQTFFAVDGNCPKCNSPLSPPVSERLLKGSRVKCNNCGGQSTWRDGTPLDRSRLSDAQFVVLLLGLTWGVPPVRIAAVMSVDPQTVRDWRDRLQLMMRTAA